MERPRKWFAMDQSFCRSHSYELLGETHGPGGPLVIVCLLAAAKQAGDGGAVRTTTKALAADAFLNSAADARRIVEHAIRIGTLELIELGERTIDVRFTSWNDWQPRAAATDQKARRRAQIKEAS